MMMTHFNLFSSGSVEVIFQNTAKEVFFEELLRSETKFSLKTQEDLLHEFFIFSLFVTVSIKSCISELGCRVASLDTTKGALRLSH